MEFICTELVGPGAGAGIALIVYLLVFNNYYVDSDFYISPFLCSTR